MVCCYILCAWLAWPNNPKHQYLTSWEWHSKCIFVIIIIYLFILFFYFFYFFSFVLFAIIFNKKKKTSDTVVHRVPQEGLETGWDSQAEHSQFTVQIPSVGQNLITVPLSQQTDQQTDQHDAWGTVLGSLCHQLYPILVQLQAPLL